MFKLGDKVRFIGTIEQYKHGNYLWLHKKIGTISKVSEKTLTVDYKFPGKITRRWIVLNSEIEKVIPEYIQKWEKALNV